MRASVQRHLVNAEEKVANQLAGLTAPLFGYGLPAINARKFTLL